MLLCRAGWVAAGELWLTSSARRLVLPDCAGLGPFEAGCPHVAAQQRQQQQLPPRDRGFWKPRRASAVPTGSQAHDQLL